MSVRHWDSLNHLPPAEGVDEKHRDCCHNGNGLICSAGTRNVKLAVLTGEPVDLVRKLALLQRMLGVSIITRESTVNGDVHPKFKHLPVSVSERNIREAHISAFQHFAICTSAVILSAPFGSCHPAASVSPRHQAPECADDWGWGLQAH